VKKSVPDGEIRWDGSSTADLEGSGSGLRLAHNRFSDADDFPLHFFRRHAPTLPAYRPEERTDRLALSQ
jgi:hypothetical protein